MQKSTNFSYNNMNFRVKYLNLKLRFKTFDFSRKYLKFSFLIYKPNKQLQPIVYPKTSLGLTNQFVFSDFQFLSRTKNREDENRYRSIHHFSLGDAERKAQSLDISVLYRSFLTIIFHLELVFESEGPQNASCFIFRGPNRTYT